MIYYKTKYSIFIMELIIDDREHAVITAIQKIHNNEMIPYKVKRLTVGDYAIVYKTYIILIIERKTWTDLAASIRDGREANVNKLSKTRDDTGCQLAYLIEGNPCPKSNKKYSKMPVKNLRAHLDHLAFRDGMHMIYSLDEMGSADRLFEIARNLFTVKPSILKEIDSLITNQTENKSNQMDNIQPNDTDNIDKLNNTNNTDKSNKSDKSDKSDKSEQIPTGGNINKLTEKQANKLNIQEQLFKAFPCIGSVIATLLTENNISVMDIYNSTITADFIARLKYPTGNNIGLDKAKKICNIKKYLDDNNGDKYKKIQLKLLTSVPLISKKTAELIIEKITIKKIMNKQISLNDLKELKRDKSKLGIKASVNILTNLLNLNIEEIQKINITEDKAIVKTDTDNNLEESDTENDDDDEEKSSVHCSASFLKDIGEMSSFISN